MAKLCEGPMFPRGMMGHYYYYYYYYIVSLAWICRKMDMGYGLDRAGLG
jgi:hypothetical protein